LIHARADDANGFRQEIGESVFGLLAQFTTVAKEQDALYPARANEQFREGYCNAGLAGAGRLNDERLPMAIGKPLGDALDRLDLIKSIDDADIGLKRIKRLPARPLKVHEILQAVLRIVTEHFSRRITQDVIPHPNVVAICIEDDWALSVHLLKAVGI